MAMSLKRKRRILAIDDEPAMTEWLKVLLEHNGFEVKTAIKQKTLVDENEQLKARLQDRYKFQNVIGKSKKMQELFDLIESVAASEANILIQGENGTGKELIANAIHYNSKRSKGPFIKINCAAIPKD